MSQFSGVNTSRSPYSTYAVAGSLVLTEKRTTVSSLGSRVSDTKSEMVPPWVVVKSFECGDTT